MTVRRRALDRYWVALGLVLLLAAGLRLYGLDWDAGTHQHPDERHISDVMAGRLHVPPRDWAGLLDPATSDLNPRSVEPGTTRPRQFAYGSLPLLLTEVVSCGMDLATGRGCTDGPAGRYWTTYDRQYLVGRFLTVLADLALIVVVFLLGRRAFGPTAGLAAAAFLAVSVVNIQLAHFFATDTWSALFATAALWALYRAADEGPFAGWRAWALAGVFAGASVASKVNTVGLAVPALVALWYSLRGEMSGRPLLVLRRAAVLGGATVLAFAVFEPYAFPSLSGYIRDLNEQANILGSGAADVPYTRQFTGTIPVWHYVWNFWGYGLGAGLTLLGGVGLLASARRAWRERSAIDLLLLAWFLAYGLLISTVFAKFLRYTLPLTPVLAILAGAVVARAFEQRSRKAEEQRSRGERGTGETGRWGDGENEGGAATARRIPAPLPLRSSVLSFLRSSAPLLLCTLALVSGVVQALAFASVFGQPHTRVAASEWMYENVPRGSRLAGETWDDALPLGLADGRNGGSYGYRYVEANHYHDRSPEQGLAEIERILRESDYIILASQRVSGSTDRIPWRYPIINRYYDLLIDERLGFERVYSEARFPAFGPYRIDSRWADESFSVYDHPPVEIYQKRATLGRDHLQALFAGALEQTPVPARTPPKDKPLLLTEPLWTWPDLNGEAWARPAGDSWPALLIWLAVLAGLTLVGLPWALLLLRPLADGGLWLALPLATLLIAWATWLAASLRWATFSAGAIAVATLVIGVAGWAALLRSRRGAALADLRARRWPVLVGLGVFVVAFAVQLLLRLANPDLWQPWLGGEKPMETAYLNAVLRSAYFPPYDPWFSGGYINYYYFGYVLVGVPIKLAGVAPAIAFNLAIATLYASIAAGMCSLGQTMARALAGRERPPDDRLVGAVGVGAALLMVGIGNLDGAVQVAQRWAGQIDRLDFWRSSRAVQFTITEFPYFSFLYADLHAHIIAMPLALLVVGIGLATILWEKGSAEGRVDSGQWTVDSRTRGGAVGGVMARLGAGRLVMEPVNWSLAAVHCLLTAVALGGLAVTNAWDVPAYLGVTAGAAFIAAPFARGQWVRRAAWAGGAALATGALAYLLYLPFFQGFQSFYGSIGRTTIPTRLAEFLTVWGYFLVLTLIVIGVLLAAWLRGGGLQRLTWPVIGLVVLTGLAVGAAVPRDLPGAAIAFALIGVLALLWLANGLAPAGEYALVLMIGAFAIIAGVEFVFIVDFLQGGEWYRMNTMFKLSLESWLLLCVGLAGGAALVAREWRRLAPLARGLIGGVAALGLVLSLAYPLFVTPDRLRQRFDQVPTTTLDGLAFMEIGILRDPGGASLRLDEDLAAIEWMMDNLRGAPVVAEAMIGPYRGNGARIANATGFPTILGWDNHQGQQRWPETIGPRSKDVRTLYTSRAPGPVLALLEKYDVDYVMVGQVERRTTLGLGHLGATRERETYASPEGLATLQRLADEGALRAVFQQGETTLYQVVRPLAFPGERR